MPALVIGAGSSQSERQIDPASLIELQSAFGGVNASSVYSPMKSGKEMYSPLIEHDVPRELSDATPISGNLGLL
jgi:hypothetical protein